MKLKSNTEYVYIVWKYICVVRMGLTVNTTGLTGWCL
jgi:hypothetical protein